VEFPTISLAEAGDGGEGMREAARRLRAGEYTWIVFTSANAVERFCRLLHDARAFAGASVAAIGPGTSEALHRYGVVPDLVPPEFVAESLVEAFPKGGGRVLLPRAAVARAVLPEGLAAKGWEVDKVEAYRTEAVRPSDALLAEVGKADAVTFSSSSTVTGFLEVAGLAAVPPLVACIGPVTAETARHHGLHVDTVAAAP